MALTLCDHDTPVWLDPVLAASEAVAGWLRFHTGAPLVTDLMSGQLDYGMLVLSSGLPHVRGDKIVALGVTEKKRTNAETGPPDSFM